MMYWHRTTYMSYPPDYKLLDGYNAVIAASDGYYDDEDSDNTHYSVAVMFDEFNDALLSDSIPGDELLSHLELISEAFGVSQAELHEVWQDNE